ncbi:hypothetical protein ACIGH6_05645 [Brachybacterium paraconglomeratum]|uniref:hypothetical protein n=1 Tax=Brachybacterium paraconglomeratum TaxID=173362 RepID=UPI0037C6D5C2
MLCNFLIGFAASALVGLMLWFVLPRGIVLSRKFPAVGLGGAPINDTWVLRNESSIPIRISKVEAIGSMIDGVEWKELSLKTARSLGFEPGLDSDISGGEALSSVTEWKGVRVLPGDGLHATMPGNSHFRFTYQRDSLLGFIETRQVTVYGMP